MSVKGLSQRGTANSFNVDLGEMLSDASSPYGFIADDFDPYEQDFVSDAQVAAYHSSRGRKQAVPINEATRLEIVKEADAARKARAKKLVVKYMGVTNSRGWITFKTNSQYTPGRKYTQYIKLKEAKDMKYFKEFKKRDVIRLFMSGDLQIHCTCPDHKYRFKYMAYNMGYGIFKETRFPKIRNPELKGSVCKHMLAVFSVMGMNWTSIARDMSRSKFFKKKYEESLDDDTVTNRKKTAKNGKT